MDIFNRERIEKLEAELRGVRKENDDLRDALCHADEHVAILLKIQDEIPKDCTPGTYCKGCQFAMEYHYHNYVPGRRLGTSYNFRSSAYICNKANVCKNFIQKEIKE